MRRISIFGATGSVGANGVDLIRRAGGPEAYHTVALTGGRNIPRLAQMARDLRAEVAVTAHPELLDDLRDALAGSAVQAAAGPQAMVEAAARPADWVLSAIVGAAGLAPDAVSLGLGPTWTIAAEPALQDGAGLRAAFLLRAEKRRLPLTPTRVPAAVWQPGLPTA